MNTGLRRAVLFGLALSTFGLAAAPALAEPTDEHFRRNQDRYDRAKPDRPQPTQPETRPPERPSQPERPDRPTPPGGNTQPVPGRPQPWRDPPAQPRPPQVISPGYDPGRHYYPGHHYRPRPHYVVRPSFGTRITILPPGYRTLWYGGLTYYVVDDIYYRREPNGYVVVERPDYDDREMAVSGSPDEEELFVYPNRNQDEKQQALDRYECHRWAVKQTGYDPTEPMGGVEASEAWQKRADYRRAQGACLEGRGYTVR
ncbi:hypothetical protein [Chitinimonas koreensis]|uniref:hypothetical protein n=1 Tax=Chitinimonas koreensis TaxID=356302 RepID=UPI0003FCBD74|nr:hypothetical protein [Chitinimonas koreensis]